MRGCGGGVGREGVGVVLRIFLVLNLPRGVV